MNPGRAPFAMISVAFHALALVGAAWMSQMIPVRPAPVRDREPVSVTFHVSPEPVAVVLEKPVTRVSRPAAPPEAVVVRKDVPVSPPEVLPFAPPARVQPRPVMPAAPAPVPPEMPSPPPKQKTLMPVPQEAFQASVPGQRAERNVTVQNAGFDASAPARSPQPERVVSPVGGFDGVSDNVRARGGRGSGSTGAMPVGFSGNEVAAPPTGRPVTTVRNTGFDVGPAVPGAGAARRAVEPISVPVEVTFKPVPSYTDEARTLKLEGEVLIEVEFGASGQIRVLRIVRGLGHGLDESAVHAAEQIRFKPAQSSGRAVDARAIVHIVFKLI